MGGIVNHGSTQTQRQSFSKPSHNTTSLICCVLKICHNTTH